MALALLPRRRVIQAAAAVLALPMAHSASAELAISTGINRTGRMRALSQRSAKVYIQEVLGVLPERAQDIAQTAQRLMASNLAELGRANVPPALAQQLQQIATEAAVLRTLLEQPRSRAGVPAVVRQADALLQIADQATAAYAALGKSASAKLVNLAGRQRMLSQRMAKNYFLAAAGFGSNTVAAQIEEDRNAFKQALAQLEAAPLSSTGIRNELTLAQSQWVFFEAAITKPVTADALRTVATTSERLLETMNNLTELYDAALKDLLGVA